MKFKVIAQWLDLNAEGGGLDLPTASGIIDAATPQEAYDLVESEEHPSVRGELVQHVKYILSEDENTIYFHPKIGWLPEPLVKYGRTKTG